MSSKLTFHWQMMTPWAKSVLSSAPFGWAKCMFHNPGDVGALPVKTIGRIWIGGETVEKTYIQQGANGADAYFERCRAFYKAAPWVHAWEGPNEPGVSNSTERKNLAAFTLRWVERMHQAGLRTCAYCISVGNPPGDDAQRRQAMRELGPGLATTDYWSYHSYWAGDITPEGEWHALRYRMLVDYLRDAGYRVPPLLLTEAGVDGGVRGVGRTGWKTWCKTEAQYMTELKRFDAELAKDDYVRCATLFTAGPNQDWMDFEVTEGLAKLVAAHVRAQAGAPEPEPKEEPVKPDYAGAIWKGSPNFGYPRGNHGRNGHVPLAICYHISCGSLAATDATVANPAEECSYTYGVGQDGETHQYVREEDAQWANGDVNKPNWLYYEPGINPNLTTIAIAWCAKPGEVMTEKCYQSILALSRGIPGRWPSIAVGPENQIGHCAINTVDKRNCPGPQFPWARLRADLELRHLPENEPATDAPTLAEKCRWWLEEEQRQRETGQVERANEIRLSLIKLLYRLENALKA